MVNKCFYTEKIWENYSKNAMILPHLGMSYLAALLREKGLEVHFIDANALGLDKRQIIRVLNDSRPDYLLYTSVTDNFQDTLFWIENIKQEYDKPVIVGGPHMEIYPIETLTHNCIDYGVIGDGWETLPELLNALEYEKGLSLVKGICFKKGQDIVITQPRPKNISLENIPLPARDLLPNNRYDTVLSKRRPITIMITALGCPYRCAYCCSDAMVRPRSAKHIVAEIEECIKKYGIKEIEFYDETFTVSRERVFRILDLIEERNLRFLWSIRTRPDCVDKPMIDKMARLGCIRINYGIESGDEKMLVNMGRAMSIEAIKNAIKWSKQAGIIVFGFFMIGLPGETKRSIEKTLSLMLQLDLDFVQLNKFVPLPNTKIYEDMKKDTSHDFWRDYTLGKRKIDDIKPYNISVTSEELNRYLVKGYRSFYFRPKHIWRNITAVKSFREARRMTSAALSLIR